MKQKLSKKTKTFLSVATAIIASAAVTTLLTSCSSAKESDIIDTGGYDKEYGINDVTYARMEENFKTLYKSQLDEKRESGEIKEDEYNLNLSTFQNNLNSIHASLYSDENKTLSYTLRTEALQNFAQKNYNIFLKREYFNISVSDFNKCLESFLSSIRWYFDQVKCDTELANFLYNKTKTDGNKFINELELNLDKKDLIIEMRNFQEDLTITAMSDVNRKIAEYKASQKLKEFFNSYSITSLKNVGDNYTWDFLNSDPFFNTKNADVTSYINHIFAISHEDEGGNITFSRFSNDIIPGYILTPKMKEMHSDPEKNVYKLLIDWEISVPNINKYYDDASLYSNLEYDRNLSAEYELPISKTFEYNQLNEIYLNNIKLCWDDPDKCAKEEFFTPDNATIIENDVKSLARAGLIVNDTKLSKLVDDTSKNPSNDDGISLEQKFINNCTLYAKSQIFYDDSNLIKSDFYVGFSHSFSALDANELREEHTFKFQDIEISNMEVSNEFYKNAIDSYNSVLTREIHTFASTLMMKNASLDTATTIEYIMLGAIALMAAISAICLLRFIGSLGFAVQEIVSTILLTVQIALMYVSMFEISAVLKNIKVQTQKYDKFATKFCINVDALADYPLVVANTPSKTKKESKSASAFIKRIEDDHFIFETKSEFSKTHGKITPNDRFVYYKSIASNPNNDSGYSDYGEFLKAKKECEVSEDHITDAWYSNVEKTDVDGKTIYSIKSSILDEIQNVVFFLQSFNDLVAILMTVVSPTASPAIASEKIATRSAFKALMKFLINIAVMQGLPYAIQKIINCFLQN
ncbi:MAG: hypothetical protein IJK72_03000 [Mycoplasma sp.]|nr:hypothetical protein [Mycoplasma sp.]